MIPARKLSLLTTATIALALTASAALAATSQAALDAFADHLGYRYTVLNNQAGPNDFTSELDLTLPDAAVPQDWSLYFGMVNAVKSSDSDAFDLTHLNGDLYRLTPRSGVIAS